ncbi:hypothetical protein BDP81DRAFT_19342 [Colletotrichum phormii]|uniref:Uncharacterized protein n=1 Tax=Colletotrichum phormii TaxID=359342 RepID=A0AAJ0ELG4_9PEZI|nr:uncharacterized protein BDP81DRAFT_19342 [Colletotrichum phormii]KAK1656296.1 hypothetical protein BDP81DRAFT_19342 [Colletotrichum phormii]
MRLGFSHASSSSTKQPARGGKESNFTRSFFLSFFFFPPRTISRPPNWDNLFSLSHAPHSYPCSNILLSFFLSLKPPKISHPQLRHLRHFSKPSLHAAAVSTKFSSEEAALLNLTTGSSEVAPDSLLSVQFRPRYQSASSPSHPLFSNHAPTSSLSNFFTSDLRLAPFSSFWTPFLWTLISPPSLRLC